MLASVFAISIYVVGILLFCFILWLVKRINISRSNMRMIYDDAEKEAKLIIEYCNDISTDYHHYTACKMAMKFYTKYSDKLLPNDFKKLRHKIEYHLSNFDITE